MKQSMTFKHTDPHSLHISREQLVDLVGSVIRGNRGREDDDHPLPPGPWDPVIRVAFEQIRLAGSEPEPVRFAAGPRPPAHGEPAGGPLAGARKVIFQSIFGRRPELFDAIGGNPGIGDEVALNPQPLPPRYALLIAVSQAVIRRAELLQEISGATSRDGSEQGIIIVSGYTKRFTDDWCDTGFKLRWPFPGPRPHWFGHQLDGLDLIVMATQFGQAAKEAFSAQLAEHLTNTGVTLAEAGLSRLQSSLEERLGG